jgi:hypothetical protein
LTAASQVARIYASRERKSIPRTAKVPSMSNIRSW